MMSAAAVPEPVLVLGNGPVGQTAALLLARWGVPSVLLDRRPRRDPVGSKAICQQRDVLDIWAAVGAGEQIAAEGVTWTCARTFYRDRELFSYRFADPGGSRFPPFVNISQSRTEQILDERVTHNPLVDVRWGHEVEHVDEDPAGVSVHCAGPDGPVRLRARYALACLGAHAEAVHACLGVEFDGTSFADKFLICDIRTDLPQRADERCFYFDPAWNPGRQVLIHPCPDSTFRIDWQVPPDYDLAADTACGGLERRIRAIIGQRPYEIVWSSVYRFSSKIASRFRVGRVLLAGDCAHLVAPFGARGLNAGVADAENAAWKLAFVLRGWAPEALLETYHDERHAAAVENLAVTTATMDFLVPQSAAQRQWRRRVLERAAVDEDARAQVDSGRLSEPYWYPGSPLVTAAAHRPAPQRPERGQLPHAGPGVIVPDVAVRAAGGAVSRSREILRQGLVLLAADEADLAAALDAATACCAAPVRGHRLAELDPSGLLRRALDARPGELWIVRPDAHVAAVLPQPDRRAVHDALHRTLAEPAAPQSGR